MERYRCLLILPSLRRDGSSCDGKSALRKYLTLGFREDAMRLGISVISVSELESLVRALGEGAGPSSREHTATIGSHPRANS